ncbi:hypothetical protein WMY93_031364 [Mugilogobius chulae]|uniref:Uncharacterized protein n=1 Tax=Mugilogobius chulae TaxID=88201 RepID=A0AAW0MIP0_9GOBI
MAPKRKTAGGARSFRSILLDRSAEGMAASKTRAAGPDQGSEEAESPSRPRALVPLPEKHTPEHHRTHPCGAPEMQLHKPQSGFPLCEKTRRAPGYSGRGSSSTSRGHASLSAQTVDPGSQGRLVSKSQSGAFSPPWGEKRTLGIERPQRNGANPGRRSSADGRLQEEAESAAVA